MTVERRLGCRLCFLKLFVTFIFYFYNFPNIPKILQNWVCYFCAVKITDYFCNARTRHVVIINSRILISHIILNIKDDLYFV